MPGDYVARQGERSHEIYVILKGEIDVIRSSGDGLRTSSIFDIAFAARPSVGCVDHEMESMAGAEDELARLQAGQSFGEKEMILETAYAASFCCKTYSVVLVLSRATLDAALQRSPSMFTHIMCNAESMPAVDSPGFGGTPGSVKADDVSRRLSSCAAMRAEPAPADLRQLQLENSRRRDEVSVCLGQGGWGLMSSRLVPK